MIFEILFIAVSGLALTLVLALAENAVRCRLALKRYKKSLPNVPFLDKDKALLGNHLMPTTMENCSQRLHKRHQELGDSIAYMINDRPALSTIDPELIKEVCIDNAAVNTNRVKQFAVPMKEFEEDNIVSAEGEQWARLRKTFAGALMPIRINTPNVTYEVESGIGKVVKAIDLELDRAAKRDNSKTTAINFTDLMQRFSLNIVMTCFYKQPDQVNFDLSEKDHWSHLLDRGLEELETNPAFKLGFLVPAVRHFIDFVIYHLHPIGKWRKQIFQFVFQQTQLGIEARKQLQELRQNGHDGKVDPENFVLKDGTKFRRNIVDYIIDHFISGKLERNEYVNSSVLLFSAGYKTTSDVLMFLFYQLAMNPEMQKKLRNSIKEHGTESEYLDWTIKESLRLFPPANVGASRAIGQEVKLKQGGTLPVGTFILTHLYSLHRLKKYWGPDAEEFRPNRWSEADKFHPAQYLPFGTGLRVCPGRHFAKYEMKKLICTLLSRYSFECNQIKEDLYDYLTPIMLIMIQKTPFKINVSKLLT